MKLNIETNDTYIILISNLIQGGIQHDQVYGMGYELKLHGKNI